MDAVYRGDDARVAELLAGPLELDLFEAAAVGRTERVVELLDTSPELVGAWAGDGFTALHLAAFFRHPEAARVLLARGAPVDPVARHEQLRVTPLQSAVAARQTETAALLLERGADPNARQEGAFAPLHSAASQGDEAIVDLLLAHGADVTLAAKDGRTAADFARENGHEPLADRLSAAG